MDISGNNNIELAVSEDSGILGDDEERIKISGSQTELTNQIINTNKIIELTGRNISPDGSQPSDTEEDTDDGASSSGTPTSFELNRKPKHYDIKYKKLSYETVQRRINATYEQDIVHRYSSALDVLASYIKGHKIIYILIIFKLKSFVSFSKRIKF